VWPGAVLLNDYLSKNAEMLKRLSVIELGSGVGMSLLTESYTLIFGPTHL